MSNSAAVPDALLLMTSSCPHCPAVLQGLSELVKAGRIGRLEVVNIEVRPEAAQALGVRGVPWVRIGPFQLEGLRTPAELKRWAERAYSPQGMADYFRESLETGKLPKVSAAIEQDPARLDALLLLLSDPLTDLHVRVGIGAVIEGLSGSAALAQRIDQLGALARAEDAHIRGDACHYLALTRDPRAIPHLERLLNDPERQVRELATDGLAELQQSPES
jgi:thioredoxin-like negative regulator of GroEL